MSKSRAFLLIGSLLAMAALGAIRGPGKYNGTVIFDRWGGCHLYSGVYDMEISESVKELLRPYAGRPVLIDAKQVFQPMNPGDGLITKFEVLGPAEETTSATFGHPPMLHDLSLKVLANFTAENGPELILELQNTGTVKRGIDTASLGPTLLAKKQGHECFSPSDGPSTVAITRTNINFMHQYPVDGGSCVIDVKGRTVRMWLLPGIVIPKTFDLDPGQSIDIPLRFEFSQGEYEFLAGYGGGVHVARTLVSNHIAFDVDEKNNPKIIGPSADSATVPRTRRTGLVCGSVMSETGSPIEGAKVFLWPFPISKQELRAANYTITNQAGEFRMENVAEGSYALSAVRIDGLSTFTAASGDGHLADATGVVLPVFPQDCSIRLALRRSATYTVRGRTMPPPAGRTYSARIILKRGDAYPFELSVPISSDGRYEFKAIPAGWYQFFAGNVGSGFEADHDIDNFDVNIDWKLPKIVGGGDGKMPISFHEAMAYSSLSAFRRYLQAYDSQYHLGFPASLKHLGQPPSWATRNAEHAGFANDNFPGNEFAEDGSCISQGSYRITYQPGARNEDGKITGYLISARPVEFGNTGKRSFVVDESGKVHSTDENRSADLSDPVVTQ